MHEKLVWETRTNNSHEKLARNRTRSIWCEKLAREIYCCKSVWHTYKFLARVSHTCVMGLTLGYWDNDITSQMFVRVTAKLTISFVFDIVTSLWGRDFLRWFAFSSWHTHKLHQWKVLYDANCLTVQNVTVTSSTCKAELITLKMWGSFHK